MAEGFTTAGANTALDATGAAYSWIKMHVGAPGAAGTANAAAETIRKQATWGAAADATLTNANQLQWTNVAGSEDWTHFSAWSASSGGTCGFTGTVTANPVTAGDAASIAAGGIDATLPVAS